MLALALVLAAAPRYDVAPARPLLTAPVAPRLAGPHTIFLNFDGVTLEAGQWTDDATMNRTVFPDLGGVWPPFGDAAGSALRAAIMTGVRADFDPFGVTVTDTRPASGLYTMVVVSPRSGGGQTLGVSNVACGGANLAGIAFAFFGASGGEPDKIASTISHEAAHSLGLDHVMEVADVMYPTYQGGDPAFLDECVAYQADALCTDVHARFCPAGQQNSVAELAALLGTGEVDEDGPMLAIVAPADGDHFAIGDVVEVEVEASDAVGIDQVKLYRGDTLVGTDIEAPYGWSLEDLDEGVLALHAIGIDGAGNQAESTIVTIAIGDAELPDDDGGSSSDDDSGGVATWPGADGSDDARGDDGCGCTSTDATPTWAVLFVLAIARSRRRARRITLPSRRSSAHAPRGPWADARSAGPRSASH